MPLQDTNRVKFELLLNCLPKIAKEKSFALKGGTAINLFLTEFPRLSVDIDLTYLPIEETQVSLQNIETLLNEISKDIGKSYPELMIDTQKYYKSGTVIKLFIGKTDSVTDTTVKIEVNPVARGSILGNPNFCTLNPYVQSSHSFEMQVLSVPDIYAGKFHAALNRQQPRDLYDVCMFFENFNLTDEIREAFVVHLVSERFDPGVVLNPQYSDLADLYEGDLAGMMNQRLTLDELTQTGEKLVIEIVSNMPDKHKDFIISFFNESPEWNNLEVSNAEKLPAVKWKLQKLKEFSSEKKLSILKKISHVFEKI